MPASLRMKKNRLKLKNRKIPASQRKLQHNRQLRPSHRQEVAAEAEEFRLNPQRLHNRQLQSSQLNLPQRQQARLAQRSVKKNLKMSSSKYKIERKKLRNSARKLVCINLANPRASRSPVP